jgi:hypothetical protein
MGHIMGLRDLQGLLRILMVMARRGVQRTRAAAQDTLCERYATNFPSASAASAIVDESESKELLAAFPQLMQAIIAGIGVVTANRAVLSAHSFAISTTVTRRKLDGAAVDFPELDLNGIEFRLVSYGRRYGWFGIPLPRLMWRRRPLVSLTMSSGPWSRESQTHTFTLRLYVGALNRMLRRCELQAGVQSPYLQARREALAQCASMSQMHTHTHTHAHLNTRKYTILHAHTLALIALKLSHSSDVACLARIT